MTETVFEIGGQSYNVVKKGLAQAQQVSLLGGWLGKYGTQLIGLCSPVTTGRAALK